MNNQISSDDTRTDATCKRLRDDYDIAVVTNDIYTREDVEALVRTQALSSDLLIINKTDLAPHVDVSVDAMERDTIKMRDGKPYTLFTRLS